MAKINDIRIQISADTKQLRTQVDASKKKLNDFKKTTEKVTKGQKNFQENLRNVAGSIAAVQGPLGPVAGRLNAIGAITGRVNLGFLALLAVVTSTVLVLGKLVRATANAERQLGKLEGILKATGNAAGLTLNEIEELAFDIGKETLASTRDVRDAAGVLLTFKSITGDTFKTALRLSQDLAEVGFGSVKTAALQLGKALEEPKIGLAALRRVGVSFNKVQKEQIEGLVFLGKKQEAQKIITQAINEQVGGAGVKAAQGLAGAIDTLGEKLGRFFERTKVGQAIVGFLTDKINTLSSALGDFELAIDKMTRRDVVAALKEVNAEIEKLDQKIKTSGETLIDPAGMNPTATVEGEKMNDLLTRKIALENKLFDINEAALIQELNANKKKKSEEIPVETKLEELSEKEIRRLQRQELLLGKTTKQRELLNHQFKIEDELIKNKVTDPEIRAKFIERETEALIKQNEQLDKARELQTQLNTIAKGVSESFRQAGDQIVDAFLRGKTEALNFRSILQELLIAIQKAIIDALILDKVTKAIKEGIEGGGGFSAVFKRIFTGKATGGAVQARTPTLVGERGPELFVPRTAGAITPSSLTPGKMGGGTPLVINQNLNFALGVTNTVRSEIANLLPSIQQSTISAVADAKVRGGKFAKAFGG